MGDLLYINLCLGTFIHAAPTAWKFYSVPSAFSNSTHLLMNDSNFINLLNSMWTSVLELHSPLYFYIILFHLAKLKFIYFISFSKWPLISFNMWLIHGVLYNVKVCQSNAWWEIKLVQEQWCTKAHWVMFSELIGITHVQGNKLDERIQGMDSTDTQAPTLDGFHTQGQVLSLMLGTGHFSVQS